MKPRVFVSSVMIDFNEYRQATRRAILKAGGAPVLVEDYPGLTVSPRTACLDGVASCDIYIVIVGERGGWTTPSGKLVVEEEYEEARKKKLPVLVFVLNVDHDQDAQRFIDLISDYVNGVYRPTFDSASDLELLVEKALVPLIQHLREPKMDSITIQEIFNKLISIYNEAILRFVISPERVEEMIDPVSLESPEIKRQLYEIGHSPHVNLFSYECPKSTEIEINEIIISQSNESNRRDGVDEVRLEINTKGVIIIDINVSGRPSKDGSDSYSSVLAILEEDIYQTLKKCFSFTKAFFELKDPYNRYDRLICNAALCNIGQRAIMKELPRNGSYSMGFNNEEMVIAFDQPRFIIRSDLNDIENEITIFITLFRRRLKS